MANSIRLPRVGYLLTCHPPAPASVGAVLLGGVYDHLRLNKQEVVSAEPAAASKVHLEYQRYYRGALALFDEITAAPRDRNLANRSVVHA